MTTKRIYTTGVALIASLLIAAGLVGACSGPTSYPTPASWTVGYAGQTYCPYEYSPYEIDMYGYVGTCNRVAFPSISVVPVAGTIEAALMLQWTTYATFYGSGFWYDTYYAPIGARYHVTVISRSSYTSNVSTFQRTYASQIKTNSAKAKWGNGKTGNYQFPTSNSKVSKPLTNQRANDAPAGNSGYNSNPGPVTNARPAAPAKPAAPKAPAGKPGGRR